MYLSINPHVCSMQPDICTKPKHVLKLLVVLASKKTYEKLVTPTGGDPKPWYGSHMGYLGFAPSSK